MFNQEVAEAQAAAKRVQEAKDARIKKLVAVAVRPENAQAFLEYYKVKYKVDYERGNHTKYGLYCLGLDWLRDGKPAPQSTPQPVAL